MPLPQQFPLAAQAVRGKALAPTALSSAELERVPAAIRARSFFSARVLDTEVLGHIQREVERLVRGPSGERLEYSSPAYVRTRLKQLLAEIGYEPENPAHVGTIADLRTNRRLDLIIDMNTRMASGYAHYIAGQAPDALRQYPALEFMRIHQRRVPRGWELVQGDLREVTPHYWLNAWRAAGGRVYSNNAGPTGRPSFRMIAPKGDPIWTEISRFSLPYGPPDFNSGYGQVPVSLAEARKLGVPLPQALKAPVSYTQGVKAPLPDAPPDMLEILLQQLQGVAHRDGEWLAMNN